MLPVLSLAFLAALFGYTQGGFWGALTGALTVVAIASGAAVAAGRSATGSLTREPSDPWQRRGGLLAALGSLILSVRNGWAAGWLGAIAGYASGRLAGLVAAALSLALQRPGSRRGQTAPRGQFDLHDESDVRFIDRIREDFSRQLADESAPYADCWFKPAALLPHPKETIRQALNTLLDFVEGRRDSPYLDRRIRSPEVAQTLRACLALLERYLEVPEEDLPSDPEENRRAGLALLSGKSSRSQEKRG